MVKLVCPICKGVLHKNNCLFCKNCGKSYLWIGKSYDLFVEGGEILQLNIYRPELECFHYTFEKILGLRATSTNKILDNFFNRHLFNKNWEANLKKLKNTVSNYGTSERKRTEDMVDDYDSAEFKLQRKQVQNKAEIIMRYILSVKHAGNNVLHIGCGGLCNDAIPIEYSKAGFKNYGIDVVRSCVNEFCEYGQAYLANALALPFANETFDIVNFTDILEHLFDPLLGLREAARVLKKGGYILLDTNNRAYLNTQNNPLFLLEYLLGVLFPETLRRRIIMDEWVGVTFFHTEFTKRELVMLLKEVGLTIKKVSCTDFCNMTTSQNMKKKIGKLIKVIFPTGSWFVLAQKEDV